MRTVYAKHMPYEDGHLGLVRDEMLILGPPTIRVMEYNRRLYALEGSHRLAVAYHLGLVPKLVVLIADMPDYGRGIPRDLPSYCFEAVLLLRLSNI